MSDRRRRQPRWLFRGEPITEPLPLVDLLRRTPYRDAQVRDEHAEERAVHAALDLAARVGELMLRCGAGAPQVESSVIAIATAAGLTSLEMDITLQSLLIQSVATDSGHTLTVLRVVRSTRYDYARLVAVHDLVDALIAGDYDTEGAAEQLRRIKARPRVWSDWAVAMASALLAASIMVMIGAALATGLITLVVGLLIAPIRRRVARMKLPDLYGNALMAGAVTVMAWGAYALGAEGLLPVRQSDFAFIVAGGIVSMLPGRAIAAAVEDVIFGYAVTGAGRLLAVAVSLVGLIVGIGVALGITARVTDASPVSFVSPRFLDLQPGQATFLVAVVGAFVVGMCGAVVVQSRRRLVLPTGLLAVGAALAYALLTRSGLVGDLFASGAAAILLGFAGRFVALRLRAPAMVLVVPASYVLLPGLAVFRGLYDMVRLADVGSLTLDAGLGTLLGAGAVLLTIAAGSSLGEILASPWDRRVGWRDRRRARV